MIEIIKAQDWQYIRATLPSPKFLLDPLIPAKAKTLLHGPPNVGKSAFIWGVGNAIMTNESYLGLHTTQARVFLLSTDMSIHDLNFRWKDNFTPAFDFACVPKFDCTRPTFVVSEIYTVIGNYVQDNNIDLVLIDALGGIHMGRSAKDDEVAGLVEERLSLWFPNKAILLLGHDRKTRFGVNFEPLEPNNEDFLGSQMWRANTTSQLHMWASGDHKSTLKHDKSQVSLTLEEPLNLYIDIHGRAELWNETRAQKVLGLVKKSIIDLPDGTAEERAEYIKVSRATYFRWKAQFDKLTKGKNRAMGV